MMVNLFRASWCLYAWKVSKFIDLIHLLHTMLSTEKQHFTMWSSLNWVKFCFYILFVKRFWERTEGCKFVIFNCELRYKETGRSAGEYAIRIKLGSEICRIEISIWWITDRTWKSLPVRGRAFQDVKEPSRIWKSLPRCERAFQDMVEFLYYYPLYKRGKNYRGNGQTHLSMYPKLGTQA